MKKSDSQTCRYDGQIYLHWYKILGLLYKRALFDLQFVHNLFWLKLKWNARSKLFYCIILRSSIWSSRTLTKLKSQSQKRFKGILSTKIVIFSYPKLLSFSVLTFIKWRLTMSYAAKDTIFWQKKTQNYRYQNYCRMTIFKSIHMAFYVSTSWACALFRNNKQHVVLGQKRNCQRVEESGLWRIQR